MYFVYILLSKKDGRTYIGYAKDVGVRLSEHNAGRVKATEHRRPLELWFTEKFPTMQEAKRRELWWKSSSGRRELKKRFREKTHGF